MSQRAEGQYSNNPTTLASAAYIPPHMNSSFASLGRTGNSAETRYSKDQLLDMFRIQQDRAQYPVEDLFIDGWTPDKSNGLSNGGWGRNDDHKDANGPEICWDHKGGVQRLGLIPMSEPDKEVRTPDAAFLCVC